MFGRADTIHKIQWNEWQGANTNTCYGQLALKVMKLETKKRDSISALFTCT